MTQDNPYPSLEVPVADIRTFGYRWISAPRDRRRRGGAAVWTLFEVGVLRDPGDVRVIEGRLDFGLGGKVGLYGSFPK